jgi:lipopolysaccharide export system protein LptC
MIERRHWGVIVALAAIAAITQVWVWLARPRPLEAEFTGPPRSGYTLDDFTLNALDESGNLSFTMTGPRLSRHAGDGSIFVSTPDYVMVDGDGNPWLGTSESAWVSKDGSVMRLDGKVEMRRTPSATVSEATILTANLIARPKEKKIETEARAQIQQPGSILSGTGLRGDLNSKVLELLSDVENTFEPTRSRRNKR